MRVPAGAQFAPAPRPDRNVIFATGSAGTSRCSAGSWEALVTKHRVSGKATHDVRIVAAMIEHGQTSILTFNTADFKRYPGIEVVHPAEVISPEG